VVSSPGGSLTAAPAEEPGRVLQIGSNAAQVIVDAGRGIRERVREALLRVIGGLTGPGGDTSAVQVLGASSTKIASACAGVAAGVCIAASAVPGVGGIGLPGHQSHAKEQSARSVPHLTAPSERSALVGILPKPHAAATSAGGKEPNPSAHERARRTAAQATEPSTAQPAAPVSNSPADTRVSGRQTGTEVGVESGGRPLPASPAPAPPSSPGSSSSGRVAQGGQNSSENRGESRAEFGM
jgi:hypothetical protein